MLSKIKNNELLPAFLLLFMTFLAIFLKNSSFSEFYNACLEARASVSFLDYSLSKPLFLWVNDGLVAIFFFWIGLEVKKEILCGELNTNSKRLLPLAGALGGIIVPALIYSIFNFFDTYRLSGFAIPTGTDTAFAIAILLMLKNYVPNSVRVFLLSLAIFDDIAAIIIIAIFYTNDLLYISLVLGSIGVGLLFILNIFHCTYKMFYLIVGAFIWVCVLESGVHTTLAGMLCAFFIPLHTKDNKEFLEQIMHDLTPYVNYAILPIFALFNAGVLLEFNLDNLNSVFFGIFFGLFIGKQLGVFSFCLLANKLGATLPSSKKILYGASILTGIGFTMSFFINTLVFEGNEAIFNSAKLAVLSASCCSAVLGFLWLRFKI
ncbi:Na+/H+ antiporter NhaA [Campylobacter sp. RM12654]|uniref:Na+/H+ antiporter NhaA n=1 Tax=unclassified Campylobacter TaxID=2593542 RepID=UPI001EFBE8A1|nr:Na+/H+ antiporter NhaA [Campylobacter sp. RM12651]MBZ7978583.1 Na+/H+ antiporter NhaA [Campylobacter sp. RM12654]ULO04157.1 sodium:proton antiporter [Campylobacter sp. RM12651]